MTHRARVPYLAVLRHKRVPRLCSRAVSRSTLCTQVARLEHVFTPCAGFLQPSQ